MNQPDPTRTDGAAQHENAMFSTQMLSRCILTDSQRESFIKQSAMSVVNDEASGYQVVAYRHPNGKVLIDEVRKRSPDPSAAAPVIATVEQRHRNLAEHIYNTYGIYCPKERQSIYENDIAVLLAEAVAELRREAARYKAIAEKLAAALDEYEEMLDIVADLEVGEPNGPCAANRAWAIREHLRCVLTEARAAGLLKETT